MVHNNVSADPIIHYNGYFGRGLDFPSVELHEMFWMGGRVDECSKDDYTSINFHNKGYDIAGVECRDSKWHCKINLIKSSNLMSYLM